MQDFQTDEKLMECSAAATGVYIRLMCIMHKTEPYGTILLRQKDKQSADQILNFATKVAKSLPYPLPVIVDGITELLAENVLRIDGDKLLQKRMVKDGEISLKRSKSGKKGGDATKERSILFAQANGSANHTANSEIEYVIESENENEFSFKGAGNFSFTADLPIPANTLESAERNQYTHTRSKNTEFVKEQWGTFLSERLGDTPQKKKEYRSVSDLSTYFLNFLRSKFPTNGQHAAKTIGKTFTPD